MGGGDYSTNGVGGASAFLQQPRGRSIYFKRKQTKNPMISNILFSVQAPFWVLQDVHQGGNWREKVGLCAPPTTPSGLSPLLRVPARLSCERLSCDLRGLPLAVQRLFFPGPVSCLDWMHRDRGDCPEQPAPVCPQPCRRSWICRRSLKASRIGTVHGACIQWWAKGGSWPRPLLGPKAGEGGTSVLHLNSALCPCASHNSRAPWTELQALEPVQPSMEPSQSQGQESPL